MSSPRLLLPAKRKSRILVCDVPRAGRPSEVHHANADAIARRARLRYFKDRATDAVPIADAYLVIKKSLDGEVFPELAENKIIAAQKVLLAMVRMHLVDEHGAVLPAVTGEIGLRISIDIELAHHSPSISWRFPD